jgi:hypothetical protein
MKEILRKVMPPALLLVDSAGRIVGEFWWSDQEFSPFDIIAPWFSMLVYHLGEENRPVGGRSSET